jgi:hypothetical protein
MKVIILDTDALCVWLKVTDMDHCGPDADRWDYARVNTKITQETAIGNLLVLPLATIIETGNHISQCRGDRFEIANRFKQIVLKAANHELPWAAIAKQNELWSPDALITLINNWPEQAAQKRSIGDVTIQSVAEFYARVGVDVEILTGDQGLKAYQPTPRKNPFSRR